MPLIDANHYECPNVIRKIWHFLIRKYFYDKSVTITPYEPKISRDKKDGHGWIMIPRDCLGFVEISPNI